MRTGLNSLQAALLLTAIAVLTGLVGCQPVGLVYDPQSGRWVSPLPTAMPPISPLPTPTFGGDGIDPTLPPSPTMPPFPTPLPTPVVTPIPTVAPPIIPEVVGKTLQPFWIIYWQGNEIWRIDDQGKERQLLLDTYKQLGQWLTDIPNPYKDTDCCWIGPRVVVSPDGQKLALVVVDKIGGTPDDRFTFNIYVLDVPTGNLNLVGEGVLPVWSPDGRRIAFLNEMFGALWIADLETGQMRERIARHEDPNVHITEFDWSPDGAQIAYLHNFNMQRLSTAWVANADDRSPPRQLFSLDDGYPIYGITWSPDGQQMLFLSPAGGRDTSSYHRVQNLWAVSLATSERTQLTQDMIVGGPIISPDNKWLFFSGYHLYERSQENHYRDLWLMSMDGEDLRRITANQEDLGAVSWSPDGTHLIVWRAELPPLLFSLENGTTTALAFDLGPNYRVGGIK